MAKVKKEQSESKNNKLISDKQHIKLLQNEISKLSKKLASQEIQLTDTQAAHAELISILTNKNDQCEHWITEFDNLAKEHDQVFAFLYETVNKMKEVFKKATVLTGEITLEDTEYHMNLILRLVAHKFLKEKAQD